MASAKLILAAVFALTLSSGVVTGMLVSHLPGSASPSQPTPPTVATPRTPMEQALGLKPYQEQEMQRIWGAVRDTADDCYVQAQDLQRQQWQALVNILTDEQKTKFQKVDAQFKAKFDALKKQREAVFEKAVQDTDKILDESQRKRFHDLIKTRVGRTLGGDTPPWLNPTSGAEREAPPTTNPTRRP